MDYLLFALWFFLPAGVANAVPVIGPRFKFLNFLGKPIDGGKTWKGQRILGENKTWRGLLIGVLCGILIALIQTMLALNFTAFESLGMQIDYTDTILILLLGAFMSFGALLGDAVESFLKRQLKIKPGNSWFPFDQTDYIVGGILFSLILIDLKWQQILGIFLIWFATHLITVYVFWLLGVRKKPI